MTVIASQMGEVSVKPDIVPRALPVTAMLTARIASLNVPLSKITALKAGSTLLLGLPTDQPVEVLSGGRDGPVMLEGDIGRKGNKIAVKITGMNRSLIKDQGPDR
jgi:flagellar motor switch protein FliM